jgi:hypothetical protein
MNAMTWIRPGLSITALSLLLVACGGDQAKPEPPPPTTSAPTLDAPDPDPAPEPEAAAGGGDGAGGAAAKTEEPGAALKAEKPKSSGRPSILMGPSKKISATFGATPGAVLKLKGKTGNIVWKIPEFALDGGFNITFSVVEGAKAKKKGRVLGSVARVEVVLGGKQKAKKTSAREGKFEVRWPIGSKMTVNLAIGEVTMDSGNNETRKIKWRIIEPASVDTSFKEAYFYITEIGPVMYWHATDAIATPAEGG